MSDSQLTKEKQVLSKAIKVASKKIPTLGDKALNQNLEFFCGSFADAYRAGVEEAQGEIIGRLKHLGNNS